MGPALDLPRLLFGAGALGSLAEELALLGVARPLLISDRGLEQAGVVGRVSGMAACFLDVPENPTAEGADKALSAYRRAGCDGVVALGGGSVLDTAKIVAALAGNDLAAATLIGRPDRVRAGVPLVAVPTTVGTGSESSPVAALHLVAGGPAIGTRHSALVPAVAICDPNLAATLPPHLVAGTAIDALSHCIEGFFAEPANPVIDALALDGAGRVFASAKAALQPDAGAARASLMAAAFVGGAAIHKGLGPAHAVALACADQHVHHGTLIAVVLPHAVRLVAAHVPAKAARLAHSLGLAPEADLGRALANLAADLDLPATLAAARYRVDDRARLVDAFVASHFNRTSPYVPTRDEYAQLLESISG